MIIILNTDGTDLFWFESTEGFTFDYPPMVQDEYYSCDEFGRIYKLTCVSNQPHYERTEEVNPLMPLKLLQKYCDTMKIDINSFGPTNNNQQVINIIRDHF